MSAATERLSKQLCEAMRQHLSGGGSPVLPEAGKLLWGLFAEISATRTYHARGPNPISHAEIESYARLHRWPLEPHHVEIIRDLDAAWLDHAYATVKAGSDGKAAQRKSSQAITPALFDAVFG